uniref:Retrotransposon gag domain-containing protein n=1 Tax=Fagus sylvatica TaxID=28930 RepID=A0A2N9J874_FAGSY
MGKTKQELRRPRKLPWPTKLIPLKGNDHRSPALRWSLLILNMELRKNGLELIYGLWVATMPPKRSTRQNSVANSHVEVQSQGHSHAIGETHALGGERVPEGENPFGDEHVLSGGGIPVDEPQQMALMFEMIKGMQQTQMELAESLKQLREVNSNKEDHQNKNDNRNHEERESHNKNDTPFVTMSDVADLLKQERERPPKEPRHFVRKPPYPIELLKEPYPEKYDTPTFALFDGVLKIPSRQGPTVGIRCCLLGLSELGRICTKQQIGEDLVKYIHYFRDVSLDCHVKYQEGELVEVCIDNMLPEFRAHLENLDISRFAPLLQKARKTAIFVKPHVEKGRDKKSLRRLLPCLPQLRPTDEVIKLPKITKQPTAEEKKDPKYCRYHRYVHHPTVDCRTLRWEVNRKIQDGTLQLSEEQQKVHKTSFPNYKKDKNKAVVSVVIHGNVNDMEVEESAAASSFLVPATVKDPTKKSKIQVIVQSAGVWA